MEIKIDYTPTPKQLMFHHSTAKECLFGGAAGGGKSKATVMDALFRCLQYPGTTAYIFRRTYRELEDSIIKEAMASYPAEIATYNTGRHEHKLINGSKILYRHCENMMDAFSYKGMEIQWLYFDELTTFSYDVYTFLRSRLRAKKSLGVKPCVRCTSNPGDIGHAWVKARFVDSGPYTSIVRHEFFSKTENKTKYTTTQYIPAFVTENPHISQEYIDELEQKPEALRRALLFGEWDAFEGQVFTEWTDKPEHYRDGIGTHVIEPFDIPLSWARYCSFDFGFSKPFSVGWWALRPDGCLIRYREWYGCNGTPNQGLKLSVKQIAAGILEREREEALDGVVFSRYADPSIVDSSRGVSVCDQMREAGVNFLPADHTRISGKMQFHERLRFGDDGRPRMQVFSTCKDFIRTIPALSYSLTKPEDIDSDGEDHQYDEARYLFQMNPIPRREAEQKPVKAFSPYEKAGR